MRRTEVRGVAKTRVGGAGPDVEVEPRVVPIDPEIRDAGQRVGAISGRSPARYHLYLLQQRGREVVDVHTPVAVGGDNACTVEQHERALRTHSTHVQSADAGGAEQCATAALRALRGEELRQLVELVGHRPTRLKARELVGSDRGNRHRRRETGRALDARARHRDLIRHRLLGECVATKQQTGRCSARERDG